MATLRSPLQKHILRAAPQSLTTTLLYHTRLPHSTSKISSSQHRMASNNSAPNPSKNEWLILIPDHPNALQKRLAVRSEHLANMKPNIENRTVVLGGATLSKHPEDGQAPDMNGSFILVQADTKEQAMELLRNDVYTKGGAWNIDAAQVWPFKSAFRTPV